MIKQSQWLFEAPFVLESDRYTNPYTNPEDYSNAEWELQEAGPAGSPQNVVSNPRSRLLATQLPPESKLPSWARLYLKSVRKGSLKSLLPYIPIFTIITFHPRPLSAEILQSQVRRLQLDWVDFKVRDPFEEWPIVKRFFFNLRRVRDARLKQDKSFKDLHANHRKLWQEVVANFRRVKPKDIELLLIKVLLAPPALFTNSKLWQLGKRFAKVNLPTGLSTRVAKSEWYMQDALFATLASMLCRTAQRYQDENPNFKKQVEAALKAAGRKPSSDRIRCV
jgi:hypothetical protein